MSKSSPTVLEPSNGFVNNICDYGNRDKDSYKRIKDEDLKKLRDAYSRFLTFHTNNISAPISLEMIKYSNFRVRELNEVIRTPGCVFIRIFNGIDESGAHFTFIAPIDASGNPIKTDEAVFQAQCCACPPHCDPSGGLAR